MMKGSKIVFVHDLHGVKLNVIAFSPAVLFQPYIYARLTGLGHHEVRTAYFVMAKYYGDLE